METILFKNRTQEDIKCVPLSQDCNCISGRSVSITASFIAVIVEVHKHSKICQIKYSRCGWKTHTDFGHLKQNLRV